ncbi:MAG: hypothetical protein NDI69_11235 [Bacteriovoracaceae bacterium]|nr:hypothetical protein [Bacteriovoracaceae bacterium]
MRPRPHAPVKMKRPETPEKLFTQVIEASQAEILQLWEEGDRFFPKEGTRCEEEIQHEKTIGRSYYQCNPHFWQCYWQNGVEVNPSIKVDLFGQTFHVVAQPVFEPIKAFSNDPRFYELFKKTGAGINLQYGYMVELSVKEIPGVSQPMLLADTCRDTYLPERIYGYGKDGFIWDNFGRNIFIDKFYVTNRQVNEWRILKGEASKVEADRKKWPLPALLSLKEQINYCAFYGKRLLEAKLFDAASMSPSDFKDTKPERIIRPDTPWQRDHRRSFLGMARINPDYQLTPLDCQLAQVKGCQEKYFSTDSATWMGFHYSLGFYPESLRNVIEPNKNLKMSSHLLSPDSAWHELGKLADWNGQQNEKQPVAFRCYEEVVK